MKKKGTLACIIAVLLTVLLNAAAWKSTAFCDFYAEYIFPFFVNTMGRFSNMFHFSVGEVMIVGGLLILAMAVMIPITAAAYLLFVRKEGRRKALLRFCGKFYKAFACVLTIIFSVMTLNCFILYHTSGFSEQYMQVEKEVYSFEELTLLRNYIVSQVNVLSEKVERDASGRLIYDEELMMKEAIKSMQAMGEEYERLSGYYPKPKALKSSDFLSQQYMQGYYFPFSMEANYNGIMYTVNKPVTMCHELAHVKGFLYEDEANLIGFLACINSEDPTFQYSGYMSVLNYIDGDFYEALHKNASLYKTYPKIAAKVRKDNVFLTEEAWVQVEQKAVVKTAVVAQLSDEFLEANLVLNGVSEGILSYSNVVGLLLDYYDGNYGVTFTDEFMAQKQ